MYIILIETKIMFIIMLESGLTYVLFDLRNALKLVEKFRPID